MSATLSTISTCYWPAASKLRDSAKVPSLASGRSKPASTPLLPAPPLRTAALKTWTKLQSKCLSKLAISDRPRAESRRQTADSREQKADNSRFTLHYLRRVTSSFAHRHPINPLTPLIPFILTLALAAFLRLYQLDLIDVRYDEASALQSALAIVQGQWLWVAPFSGSVANHPPVYLYVMALPYLLTRSFMWVAAYRVLLDVLAIGLCYAMCVRYFNRPVAILAALFYAVSPWAIQQARKTWLAPLPVWEVLLLWGLLEVAQHRKPRGWILTGIAFALALGTHLSAIYLLPVVLAVAIWRRPTLHLRPVLIGLLPLILLGVIYLGYDAQHDFANVRALLSSGNTASPHNGSLDSLRFAFWLSGGTHLSDLTGPAFAIWQTEWPGWLTWIDTLQMGLLALFFLIVPISARGVSTELRPLGGGDSSARFRTGDLGLGMTNASVIVLALWFLILVLLQLRPSQPLQLHYLLPLYPVQFVMMGWVLRRRPTIDNRQPIANNGRRLSVVSCLILIVVSLVLSWQLITTFRFTNFIAQHNTAQGGYGEPARTGLAAVQRAKDEIRIGNYFDVIVVTPGGDPQVNEAATIMDVFLADVPHRFVNADAGLILRGDATQYVFAPGSEGALNRLLQFVPPGDVLTQSFKFRADDARAYVYVQVMPVSLGIGHITMGMGQWSNGVQLVGYRAKRDGDTLSVETFTSVTQLRQIETDVHWFNHVLDANAQKLAQLDGGGVPARSWRVGDVMWQWADNPLPAGALPTAVRIGSYRYPNLEPIMLIDVAGNPAADSVELALP